VKASALVLLLLSAGALGAEEPMAQPRYSSGNHLVRPEGYREWIFVGANLGMGYSEGQPKKDPAFHNIYIQPEAYRHFARTGEFPDKTMLVMEIVARGTNASINKHGQFQDRFLGIEAAVKDASKFPEKWAYFSFVGPGGKALLEAKPFPKEACWSCHNAHGAVDNVFVQFYPLLREARPR
jgi:hypothetical protein